MLRVTDGKIDGAFLIHDVHGSHGFETTLGDGPAMVFGLGPVAAVSRIALHQRTVHLMNQVLNEVRTQVVTLLGFAGGNLNGDAAFRLDTQGLKRLHKPFRTDVRSEIHIRQ